ncbi:transcriptional regulator ATRX homolog [Bactrocera neohumeralis]|uniref:transcriptional regulator ATRX homolog n=1 Tax=Bactrocera tryoni TaxID=59916 RepID=UPI001A970E08|nr:transcriptional regulator ATRX homolog [Bactrocera tryoni]XP_039948117.1 transcriptional regulator ATRX homolog [Bactrocera tryoni]XP_039948126.1 transcriptional regulator ATRX homolog [Bactrocera tryoni]XP_050321826.1 transcriptional regulator ATRX homolog [Bactrocera neohumeralis]XP_050321911.1 transcriptional regulator ATRX homolog [Bactrocera neohumeralis]XP_050321990.1 transcriptional regulator ATRX homolog [Bactrocera neohumeralis]
MGQEKFSDSDANSAEDRNNHSSTANNKVNSKFDPKNKDKNESESQNERSKKARLSNIISLNNSSEQVSALQNSGNEFKVRVVPLEKLLEKPIVNKIKENKKLISETQSRHLPDRKNRNNCTLIELSDSEEDQEKERSNPQKIKSVSVKSDELAQHEKSNPLEGALPRIRQCTVRIKRTIFPTSSSLLSQKLTITKVNGGDNSIKNNKNSFHEKRSPASSRKLVMNSDSDESDSATYENVNKFDDQSELESDGKSSDSEVIPARKKRVFNKRKKSSDDDSDFTPQPVPKKRGRLRRGKESSDEDDSDAKRKGKVKKSAKSDEEDADEKNKNKRKHIRKIIKTKDLDITTKNATKEEEERRKRIEERQKLYNQIYEKPENVEVTELVLDFDEETKKPLLEVDRGILKKLKPHQVAGVKFMWDACFETMKEAEDNAGSGCILAHCMGLGKTLQIVTLSHTLLVNSRRTGVERVLIITPLSTLNNWAREFHHWIAFANKRNVEVYDMSKYKDKPTRIFKLNEWFEEGGACVIGYDMYRILANEKAKGLRKKQREILQQTLVDPGPDLVVCDEGHLLKNEKTSISKAVTKMRTKRRIVLTGTPLQNNLKEYYCMIQFIKPNLLGTYKEYLNRFVNPITNGQYTDSTERDIRLMKHRSHILHKMLEGCIQRRDYSVLAPYLPPKHEYTVYTTLSDLQQQLYEYYMTTQRDVSGSDISGKGARLFQDFQDLRRIWTHPMNLRMNSDTVIRKRQQANDSDSMEDFIDDDDDDDAESDTGSETSVDSSKSFASGGGGSGTGGVQSRSKPARSSGRKQIDKDSDIEELEPPQPEADPSEWWKRFVEEKELNNINHSPKLVILMNLLQECEVIGDKLLVFSQSLQSIDVIEHFLSLIDSRTKGYEYEGDVGDFKGCWQPGVDYFRLDGSCSVESREAMCKKFNDVNNLRGRLFLISTRAGGLGINLVAANRVVIFDVSWNPSHDTQSIFRVYRFGQEKPCYIYRLIAMGTMEQKVYERQVAKQATAKRVIDEQQISRHYNQSDLQELYSYELKPGSDREIPILPKDRLFAELLSKHEPMIFKYHEHDSLLENEESENLNDAERKAAWAEYEAEKTRSVQTAQYMSYDRGAFGGQLGNATGGVTSNRIFGFRSDVLLQLLNMKIVKDHPEITHTQALQLVPTYLQHLYTEMNNNNPTMYKELLSLHATLAHPSGMYMSPLLYANQNPNAAGYFQSSSGQAGQQVPVATENPPATPSGPGPSGFKENEVYEID